MIIKFVSKNLLKNANLLSNINKAVVQRKKVIYYLSNSWTFWS